MKITKQLFKKYLPDILILISVWIFGYVYYFPPSKSATFNGALKLKDSIVIPGYNYSEEFNFLALILLSLGAVILIRRYIKYRNKNK